MHNHYPDVDNFSAFLRVVNLYDFALFYGFVGAFFIDVKAIQKP
jgi:hypothetical protein